MSQRAEVPVTDREVEAPAANSASRSVALIGPNDASRKVVARALASSGAVIVHEFVSYPNSLNDIPRLAEQRFDMLMIDVDCDESYALAIVETVVAAGKTAVMAYSRRNQPELARRCILAGARDFLPIPAEPEASAADPEPTPESAALPPRHLAAAAPLPTAAAPPRRRISDLPAEPATIAAASPTALSAVDRPPLPPRNVLDPPQTSSIQQPAAEPTPVAVPSIAPVVEASDPLPERSLLRKKTSKLQPEQPELEPPIFRYVGMAPPPSEGPSHNIPKWAFVVVSLGALIGLAVAFYPQVRRAFPVGLPLPWNAGANRYGAYAAPPSAAPSSVSASSAPAATTNNAPSSQTAISVARAGRTAAPAAPAPAMDAQLSAPARISSDLKKPAPKDEPAAGFAPVGLDSGGSTVPGAAFSSQHNVRVAPSAAAVSAGVAAGMLIRRTEPIYPKFARDNHISGTVVLGATISKTGTLENLHAISGNAQLRDAAMNAARTWRYRPYLLNNQPVEVQTTISIVFNADK